MEYRVYCTEYVQSTAVVRTVEPRSFLWLTCSIVVECIILHEYRTIIESVCGLRCDNTMCLSTGSVDHL
jgi:hypothetical protein